MVTRYIRLRRILRWSHVGREDQIMCHLRIQIAHHQHIFLEWVPVRKIDYKEMELQTAARQVGWQTVFRKAEQQITGWKVAATIQLAIFIQKYLRHIA